MPGFLHPHQQQRLGKGFQFAHGLWERILWCTQVQLHDLAPGYVARIGDGKGSRHGRGFPIHVKHLHFERVVAKLDPFVVDLSLKNSVRADDARHSGSAAISLTYSAFRSFKALVFVVAVATKDFWGRNGTRMRRAP